jgi:hypothetical protein
MFDEESPKRSKHIIRSFNQETTALAKTYRIDDIWFIVTKKRLDGKSSKFLLAYEQSTGHFVGIGRDLEELYNYLKTNLHLIKNILKKHKEKECTSKI